MTHIWLLFTLSSPIWNITKFHSTPKTIVYLQLGRVDRTKEVCPENGLLKRKLGVSLEHWTMMILFTNPLVTCRIVKVLRPHDNTDQTQTGKHASSALADM